MYLAACLLALRLKHPAPCVSQIYCYMFHSRRQHWLVLDNHSAFPSIPELVIHWTNKITLKNSRCSWDWEYKQSEEKLQGCDISHNWLFYSNPYSVIHCFRDRPHSPCPKIPLCSGTVSNNEGQWTVDDSGASDEPTTSEHVTARAFVGRLKRQTGIHFNDSMTSGTKKVFFIKRMPIYFFICMSSSPIVLFFFRSRYR